MKKITASHIVKAISLLPTDRSYDYVNPSTSTKVEIESIKHPEGPIHIKRYDPLKGGSAKTGKIESISTQMIWRIANNIIPGKPINLERILGSSYNTRSAFEALIVHTPEFYVCYPGRIESMNSVVNIKGGHKHIMWLPEEPHEIGVISRTKTDIIISEIFHEAVYESLNLSETASDISMGIEIKRRHAQIQIALIMIGCQLSFDTWVAYNDRGIIYKDKKICEITGVISDLKNVQLLRSYQEAIDAALMIDCIWFRNNKCMPAVIEIEHTTDVKSGLIRMRKLYDYIPPLKNVRWVIAAPDDDRNKVIAEANTPQFKDLEVKFFPYTAIEELYSLCQRRKIKGITDDFLDCFMEKCNEN